MIDALHPCTITIEAETPNQSEVATLLNAADKRSASLYSGESRHGSPIVTLLAQNVSFFVVRRGGEAVGCGGFVADSKTEGELKRIFVAETARRAGLGCLLLTNLERAALDRSIQIMRLETGIKAVEAVSLYRRFGYIERGPFGAYAADPLSIFREKALT